MSRVFYALAVLAWVLLLFPYPGTVFAAGCFACFSYPIYARLAARRTAFKAMSAYAAGLIGVIIVPVSLLIVLVMPQARAGYYMLLRLKAAHFQLPQTWLDNLDTVLESLSFIPGLDAWLRDISTNIEQTLGEIVRTLVSGGYGFLGGTMSVFWILFLFVTFSTLGVAYAAHFRTIILTLTRLPEDIFNRFISKPSVDSIIGNASGVCRKII